jgi:hypothetical protein
MNEKELQLGNAVAGRGIQLEASRSLHINHWAGFIDLSVSLTFITLVLDLRLFRVLSEQNYVRSIMSRLILKIQKFGTGM